MRFSSLVTAVVSIAAMLAVAIPSGGCPSSDEAVCSDYAPPASFDATEPVSFKKNIFEAIFVGGCNFGTCHGNQSGSSNGVFIGGFDASVVRAGLVDQPAPELPSMPLIKPGDPRNSYLMRKMDGSNCVLDAQCTNGDCGDSMPKGNEKYDEDKRNVVRRWIAQGAPDN